MAILQYGQYVFEKMTTLPFAIASLTNLAFSPLMSTTRAPLLKIEPICLTIRRCINCTQTQRYLYKYDTLFATSRKIPVCADVKVEIFLLSVQSEKKKVYIMVSSCIAYIIGCSTPEFTFKRTFIRTYTNNIRQILTTIGANSNNSVCYDNLNETI